MSSNFVNVKIKVNNKYVDSNVKMQIGCSFENNGAIYRMNNDGLLSVFDKKSEKWAGKSEITMTSYQFDVFKSVANNKYETVNGKRSNDNKNIFLSKEDIEIAKKQYSQKKLTNDLSKFLKQDYSIIKAQAYSNNDAVAVHVANNNNNSSNGTLVFKHGRANDAINISKLIKDCFAKLFTNGNKKSSTRETITKQKQTITLTKTPTVNKQAQVKKANIQAISNTKTSRVKSKTNKNHFVDHSKTTAIPKLYEIGLNTLVKKMGISRKELEKQIVKTAKATGYSEYFIKHIISQENYEKTPRNIGDNCLTAGFGHTTLRDKSVRKVKKVTPDMAFKWLAQDIKFYERIIKKMKVDDKTTFGNYWGKLPKSMQEAIIDVGFNRDAKTLENSAEYKHLRANIKKGNENLPATAARLRQDFNQYTHKQKLKNTFTTGLMKRNCYRFLLAIRDFDTEYKAAAKRRFEKENKYYTETKALLSEKESIKIYKHIKNGFVSLNAKILKYDWDRS